MKRVIKANAYVDDFDAAVEYLISNSNIDIDAAKFAVQYIFNGMSLDEMKREYVATYLSQFTDEEWEECKWDFNPICNSIYEDSSFEGVLVDQEFPNY